MVACKADRAEEFIGKISMDFILKFKEALKKLFGSDTFDWSDEEVWINLGSTIGWGGAFSETCDEFGMQDLKEYYKELEWYDSDVFDGDISDLAVKYGVIRPMEAANDGSSVTLKCELFFLNNDETEVL